MVKIIAAFDFFMKDRQMIKQKIQTFFLTALPFGTSVSFVRCFMKDSTNAAVLSLLTAGLVMISLCVLFPKTRKNILEKAVKAQPLAAVVFTASFVLSFLPYSTVWVQLFVVLATDTVCLCMTAEKSSVHSRKSFGAVFCCGALFGTGTAFLGRSCLIYFCFVVLSFLCRPEKGERTIQDVWKDVAFPVFVLLGSFILFIAANHTGPLPSVIAESAVMLMIGGLLMTPCSSLRLTLMTVVLMLFGSYVFSTQNAWSAFNRRLPVQIERSL